MNKHLQCIYALVISLFILHLAVHPNVYGFLEGGSLGGVVFNDLDSNGARDSFDPGLQQWMVILQGGAVAETTMTDTVGKYQFANLSPGSYCIHNVVKLGWVSTYPESSHCVAISSNEIFDALNFGSHQVQSLASVSLQITDGWNMISNPLKVEDSRSEVLFPTAASSAFSYDTRYKSFAVIMEGKSYWVKFNGNQTVTVEGLPITKGKYSLSSGWNLVGSVAETVNVSSIAITPSKMTISNVYGYKNGYYVAKEMVPGNGYWVKASSEGMVDLDPAAPEGDTGIDISKLNTLSMIDHAGVQQDLYFIAEEKFRTLHNVSSQAILEKFTLPPPPPDEIFFTHYSSGRMLEIFSKDLETHTVELHSAKYPVTLSWIIRDGARAKLKIGPQLILLRSRGSTIISNKSTSKFTIIAELSDPKYIPAGYTLYQNYPNPFNPTTTIRFDLLDQATVSLSIYNILGQRVRTLLDNASFGRGTQEIDFDGSDLSEGVYFYRLQVGDIIQQKAMVLMK